VSKITGSEVKKVDTLAIVRYQAAMCALWASPCVDWDPQNISGPWRDCKFFLDKKLQTLIC